MSYFQTQDQTLPEPEPEPESPEQLDGYDEQEPEEPGPLRSPGARMAEFRERITRAVSGFDRGRVDRLALEAGEEPAEGVVAWEPAGLTASSGPDTPAGPDLAARFPVGAFGYNRASVDEYIAELEREIAGLRRELPGGMTITEEIERLGEQTSSILVVAHDQAKETTRRAQEQADRCVADAAANAVAMTEQAKRRLGDLDSETEAVWQERARLLEDARATGSALIALVQEAAERFPEETKSMDTMAMDTMAMDTLRG